MNWNEPGQVLPTIELMGHDQAGTPVVLTRHYVCAVCGAPADRRPVRSARTNVVHSASAGLVEYVSRHIEVTAYACRAHFEQVLNALCDEFGTASNVDAPPVPTFVAAPEVS